MNVLMRSFVGAVLLCSASFAAIAAGPMPHIGTWGFDTAGMDKNVQPGDDFFAYANGTWVKTTVIPADRPSAGDWLDLSVAAERDIRAIVDGLSQHPDSQDPAKRQIGDFYASWMDQPAIEARGLKPLVPYLAHIAAAKDRDGLIKLFGDTGYYSPVSLSIEADPANPTRLLVWAGQPDLGLPGRDYYLLKGEKYEAIRAAYRAYIIQIQQLAGISDAEAKADRIIALETRFATDNWAPERSRDIQQIYHPMDRAQLTALAPQYDWPTLLDHMGLAKVPTIIAQETTAIAAAGKQIDAVPLAQWRDYIAFRFVSDHASYLPKAIDDAHFGFYGKILNGQQVQRDRWKRGTAILDGALGEAVGKLYVADHYPAESQRQMTELIENLRGAYGDLMRNASWMDDVTRRQALEKLAAFDPRIGHPERYIDYSPLVVRRDDLLGNETRSEDFQWKLKLSRLPDPVDRRLWDMTPQEINAYYDPLRNQITFPAAILQPPFFDPAADAAVNYGAIGAVIGHEMGHGFDDQGRQFDASGKLRDWWSKDAAAKYAARTARLVTQYDSFEPLPGLHVNGKLTLGENLGDLGGIQAAYTAYHRYVAAHGPQPVIGGLTGDQRFFLAYAQVWREKLREELQRKGMLTDPHSPNVDRVNGIVRNFGPWYTAFAVKPTDKLYLQPTERVTVW